MAEAEKTTDHGLIREWAEQRGGRPSVIRTEGRRGGILRIDFGEPEENMEEISWDEFFSIFEEAQLAFLYQDETSGGGESRFSKFVSR